MLSTFPHVGPVFGLDETRIEDRRVARDRRVDRGRRLRGEAPLVAISTVENRAAAVARGIIVILAVLTDDLAVAAASLANAPSISGVSCLAVDGGPAACSNGVRVRSTVAEARLLQELHSEILSPEGVALLERKVREHMRQMAAEPRVAPKAEAAQIAKKTAEIDQLRTLMKAGTLSQAVAQAAIEKAEEERRGLEREQPAREEKQLTRVIRMLPRAAEALRERVSGGNAGLRDPRSITEGRNILFASFGGRIPVRRAKVGPGEKPYLIARIALKREVLLEAAAGGAAFCLQSGSGGPMSQSDDWFRAASLGVRK